jgi:hypothetical protein
VKYIAKKGSLAAAREISGSPGSRSLAGPTKWLIPIPSGLYQLSFNQMLDRFSVFPGF